MRDGRNVPAELFRLKEGTAREQGNFAEIQSTFRDLTGEDLSLSASVSHDDRGEQGDMELSLSVVRESAERPIVLAGAGAEEAAFLSTLLVGPAQRVLILDEPAINLAPSLQRRLLGRFREAGQVLVITHSADLIPVSGIDDLTSVIRLAMSGGQTVVQRPANLTSAKMSRWSQLLALSDVRGLLFASGVILCEGPTEVGALSRWLNSAPGFVESNTSIVDVGGDASFGAYVEYLTSFGIGYAILCDGPALRSGSRLEKQLSDLGLGPTGPSDGSSDYSERLENWERVGVFSLARDFGDDGTKNGEFERYLERVNSAEYDKAERQFPKSKVRRGAYFASQVACPEEVLDFWRKVRDRFDLD